MDHSAYGVTRIDANTHIDTLASDAFPRRRSCLTLTLLPIDQILAMAVPVGPSSWLCCSLSLHSLLARYYSRGSDFSFSSGQAEDTLLPSM